MFFPVISLQNKKLEVNDVGMKNPLNLCYMISCLQCFLSIDQMNYYYLKKLFNDTNENKKKPYSMMMHRLVKLVSESKLPIDLHDFSVNF